MTLNGKQIFMIIGAVVSVLMIAGPQLTDLFGSALAKNITSAAGLGNLIINGVMVALTSNTNVVFDAKSQKGVEVNVNRNAAPAIAAMAVDPDQQSIAPAPGEDAAVKQVAQGA